MKLFTNITLSLKGFETLRQDHREEFLEKLEKLLNEYDLIGDIK